MSVIERDPAPTAVLERAALLLDVFDGRGPLTLAEITRRVGLPRSSTHRLLEQLQALRWVRRQGNTYDLGMGIFEIDALVRHRHDVRQVALPFLHELHRATGMGVHLGVLDGSDVVCLARIGNLEATGLPSRIGARMPARCPALGKVLLANVSPDEGPYSVQPQLGKSGIVIDRDGSVVGASCVAAPIRGASGETVAAVSVCGATASMRIEEVTTLVRVAARGVAQRIRQGGARRVVLRDRGGI